MGNSMCWALKAAQKAFETSGEELRALLRLQSPSLRSMSVLSRSTVVGLPVLAETCNGLSSLWWSRVVRIAALFLIDMIALSLAVFLGYLLWAGLVLHQPPSVYIDLVPLLLLVPLGYAWAGLYPGFG